MKKTLEKAGIKVDLSYALDEDFGLGKHPQPAQFNKEDMLKVADRIQKDIISKKMFNDAKESQKEREQGKEKQPNINEAISDDITKMLSAEKASPKIKSDAAH